MANAKATAALPQLNKQAEFRPLFLDKPLKTLPILQLNQTHYTDCRATFVKGVRSVS